MSANLIYNQASQVQLQHYSSGAAGYNDATSASCSELTSMVMYVL